MKNQSVGSPPVGDDESGWGKSTGTLVVPKGGRQRESTKPIGPSIQSGGGGNTKGEEEKN